ncbi:MAG: hypothetical protein IPM10_07805 [Chitinophagaceae bacterium]|nr:hypothetical protein [Chitinophagaceae bacterium]
MLFTKLGGCQLKFTGPEAYNKRPLSKAVLPKQIMVSLPTFTLGLYRRFAVMVSKRWQRPHDACRK